MVALPILYRALPSWRRLGIGINKMLLSSAYDKKSHYIKLVHSRRVTSNKRRTTTYKNARYSGQFKRSTLAKVTSLFVEVFMIGCYSYFLTTLLSSPFFLQLFSQSSFSSAFHLCPFVFHPLSLPHPPPSLLRTSSPASNLSSSNPLPTQFLLFYLTSYCLLLNV